MTTNHEPEYGSNLTLCQVDNLETERGAEILPGVNVPYHQVWQMVDVSLGALHGEAQLFEPAVGRAPAAPHGRRSARCPRRDSSIDGADGHGEPDVGLYAHSGLADPESSRQQRTSGAGAAPVTPFRPVFFLSNERMNRRKGLQTAVALWAATPKPLRPGAKAPWNQQGTIRIVPRLNCPKCPPARRGTQAARA